MTRVKSRVVSVKFWPKTETITHWWGKLHKRSCMYLNANISRGRAIPRTDPEVSRRLRNFMTIGT